MSFQTRQVFVCVLLIGGTFLAGCGGHPGGTVGDACSLTGSSEECLADEICEDVEEEFGGPFCLARCEEQSDCAELEACNGVSGDNGKACHPKTASECDPDNDCG